MLTRIKSYLVKIVSAVFAASVFIITLPLTFAAMIMMLFASMVAVIVVRNRLRKLHIDNIRYPETYAAKETTEYNQQKPPIEGSYAVVDK